MMIINAKTDSVSLPPPVEQLCAPCKLIRVTIVSDAIAGRNGVGTYYEDLVSTLRNDFQSMHLICPRSAPDRSLEAFSIPLPGDRSQRLCVPRTKELYRLLDGQRPSVLVVPTLGPMSFSAFRYGRERSIPIVYINHTRFEKLIELYWPRFVSRPLACVARRVDNWAIRRAALVATMERSSETAEREDQSFRGRTLGTPLASEFLREPLQRRQESLSRVLFVGRLAHEKGIGRFLAAVRTLPNINFTVVGDGPCRSSVEETLRAANNLRYLGWLSRAEVLREIDNHDLLVLPSTVETFGTVALEALARKRFVLVSRNCGIASWPSLARGLFYFGLGESLSSAIARVAAMADSRRSQIASCSWQEVQRFNEQTLDQWRDLLLEATVGQTSRDAGNCGVNAA